MNYLVPFVRGAEYREQVAREYSHLRACIAFLEGRPSPVPLALTEEASRIVHMHGLDRLQSEVAELQSVMQAHPRYVERLASKRTQPDDGIIKDSDFE